MSHLRRLILTRCRATQTLLLLAAPVHAAESVLPKVSDNPKTYCNPLNLDYMIQETDESKPKLNAQDVVLRREAADTVPFYFQGTHYLFAAKSGGYWWSKDFVNWTLVIPPNLPFNNYSPVATPYQGALYWVASYWPVPSGYEKMFRSENPGDVVAAHALRCRLGRHRMCAAGEGECQ